MLELSCTLARVAQKAMLVCVVAAGCNNSSSSAAAAIVCEPNEAIACISSQGCQGFKRCKDDASGYAACDCTLGVGGGAAGSASDLLPGTLVGGTASGAAPTTSVGGGLPTGSGGSVIGGATSIGSGGALAGGPATIPLASGGAAAIVVGSGGTSGGVVFRRPKICDASGSNCRCINLASLGAPASSARGAGSDGQPSSTTSFETWLREKSNANVSFVTAPQRLTTEFLNGFDVILLQDLRSWDLTPEDVAAFTRWVKEGGGVIALSGFLNDDDKEVEATNKLLSFTGMTYNGGALAGSVPKGDCPVSSKQLCPQASTACCYCWNNVIPITGFDAKHPVGDPVSGLRAVGAYYGRSISASDAQVVATFEGKTVAASKALDSGKVFVWCDDWVTYTRQWAGGQVDGNATGEQLQYNPCYDSTAGSWLTADHVLQTKQFWYNVISYVAPITQCAFVINEPDVKNWGV